MNPHPRRLPARTARQLALRPANRQQGAVILIVAFSLIAIIGLAGLAIDTGRSYGVRAQLSAASDAAAVAAAHALSNGSSQAERVANGKVAAARFFDLNYPQNTRGTTVGIPSTDIQRLSTGEWRVTVNSQAIMPNSLMRVLGIDQTTVSTMSQTNRIPPDVMMVLDTSGSMSSDIGALKTAAKTSFVNRLIAGPGGDRLGLVSFANQTRLAVPIDKTASGGFDRQSIHSAIDGLIAQGWTGTSVAIRKSLDELQAIPVANRSRLRVMLIFSDGAPNVFATRVVQGTNRQDVHVAIDTSPWSVFRLHNPDPDGTDFTRDQSDTLKTWNFEGMTTGTTQLPGTDLGGIALSGERAIPGYIANKCNINRAARNATENNASAVRDQNVRIFTIGLGAQLEKIESGFESCGYTASDHGTNILRRLANEKTVDTYDPSQPAGLFCFARTSSDLDQCFAQIADEVVRLTL